MNLYLKREINPKHTIGKLYEIVNDKKVFLMYTLERPVFQNRYKLDAIPPGTYEIQLTHSGTFSEEKPYRDLGGLVPILMNVPERTGIRIHVANFVRQLEGCIAVGLFRTAYGALLKSSDAYKELHAKLMKPWNKKERITITIE